MFYSVKLAVYMKKMNLRMLMNRLSVCFLTVSAENNSEPDEQNNGDIDGRASDDELLTI